jgi:hypothetical protein
MDKEEVWGFIVTLSMCAQAASAKQEKSARHCRRQSHSGGDQSEINAIAMEIKSKTKSAFRKLFEISFFFAFIGRNLCKSYD